MFILRRCWRSWTLISHCSEHRTRIGDCQLQIIGIRTPDIIKNNRKNNRYNSDIIGKIIGKIIRIIVT